MDLTEQDMTLVMYALDHLLDHVAIITEFEDYKAEYNLRNRTKTLLERIKIYTGWNMNDDLSEAVQDLYREPTIYEDNC